MCPSVKRNMLPVSCCFVYFRTQQKEAAQCVVVVKKHAYVI